ncbi:hypothetical protein E2C01_061397 [Portunus trituberculatus]|uniref:Uncharacterized protein n=1 Tax=Portunus trituberculatus TaxID=210409 RepID=A0A5B7HE98_PORTR|nr:hypothetical protein [Portunus trituberculatus]
MTNNNIEADKRYWNLAIPCLITTAGKDAPGRVLLRWRGNSYSQGVGEFLKAVVGGSCLSVRVTVI